jgi:beta-hydroxyacyl-ACP dehydratase FabZ
MKLPLEVEDIMELLPHRYPFLLVDRVTELELGKRVVGIKNVTYNEPFFPGHFPGRPIMPGVLIIEAMAQVGGVLARMSTRSDASGPREKDAVYFMAIDKVKFRRPVLPGDQIVFELEVLRSGSRIWKVAGKARVDEKVVAEAELVASIE